MDARAILRTTNGESMKHCPQCSTGYPDSLAACPTHGLPLNEIRDLKPGMVIHHSYRIVRKLGQGGMGAVYLAQHTLMDEPRALKFLSAELSSDQAFTARFLREVRTLRQIRHPNVVDCGDLESAEDGSLFFSMEFVDGPDLRAFLRDAPQPFDVALALALTRQIAQGLAAAHARGMVHRDIKPENILLARDGSGWQPKIADFGIVATKESSSVFTRTGGTLLTVAYAAPEQWRGTAAAELDGRTDLYALGGLLYEMLAGQTVFQAESYEGWARQHQTTPPPPPSALRPELANWQGLDALVQRLLAKDREDRPKDVAELLGLLDAVRYVPTEAHRDTVAERLKSHTTELPRGKGFRRIPRWVWITFTSVAALAIMITMLAFGLPTSMIAKQADEFDKAQHYNLGGILRNLACNRGDGESCVKLAKLYWSGFSDQGVTKDNPRAARLLIRACNAGKVGFCLAVSQMYDGGEYLAKDSSRAAELRSHAIELASKYCDAGDAVGCETLGQIYEFGIGVNRDPVRAAALYSRQAVLLSKSCDAGDASICADLGRFYDDESPGKVRRFAKDYPRAVVLYTKACDAGNADGCSSLASMYGLGKGVAEDDSREAELSLKACYGGDALSCDYMAVKYQNGWGIGKDIREAAMLFNKACSMGYTDSCGRAERLH
jgi:serine/threonine protein kinase/TPR repeat protein